MHPAPASAAADNAQVFPPGARIGVLLPLPLGGVYDYVVPDGLSLRAGDFVHVPLGPRRVAGVVWGAGSGDIAPEKVRAVVEIGRAHV